MDLVVTTQASVRRIERVSADTVRLTLTTVDPDSMPRSEHYIEVPISHEVPTGTLFDIAYTLTPNE